jgi:hypothetical protein
MSETKITVLLDETLRREAKAAASNPVTGLDAHG